MSCIHSKSPTVYFLTLMLFSLLVSCGDSPGGKTAEQTPTETTKTASDPLANLHWLAGVWQQQLRDGILFEKWRLDTNGSMSGFSGFIKNSDTVVSETIYIKSKGQKVVYVPTVRDQNNGEPVPFTLIMATADSFTVENPTHDYPSKITYRKTSATTLSAQISGIVDGSFRSETFQMTKVR